MSQEYPKYYGPADIAEYLRPIFASADRQQICAGYYGKLLSDIEHYLDFDPNHWSYFLDEKNWRADRLKTPDGERKPRVRTQILVTDKGNLTLRWYPTGLPNYWNCTLDQNETDFGNSVLAQLDSLYAAQRPMNEILFLHDFSGLRVSEHRTVPLSLVRHCLTLCGIALVHRYVGNLAFFFEVDRLNEIEPVFKEGLLLGWNEFDVKRRRAEENAEYVAAAPSKIGVELGKLSELMVASDSVDRIAYAHKQLKREGLAMNLRNFRLIVERLTQLGAFESKPSEETLS